MSQRVGKGLRYKAIAEDDIAALLADDDDLSSLCEEIVLMFREIFVKEGGDRIGNIVQRLLQRFYLDLVHQAKTDLERATSLVLKYHFGNEILWSGFRVKKRKSTYNGAGDDWDRHMEAVMSYLEADRRAEVDSDEDEDDDDDDDDGLEDRNATALPHVTQMKRFMIGSNAFRNLATNCRIFLLPPDLRTLSRVILTIPNNRLWFSEREDFSMSNKFKAFAEQASDKKWCWWPLRPRMRSLQTDETRLHWQCVSDVDLWFLITDYTKKAILALRQASLD